MEDPVYTTGNDVYYLLGKQGYKQRIKDDSWDSSIMVEQQVIQTPGGWIYKGYGRKHFNLLKFLHILGFIFQVSGYVLGQLIVYFHEDFDRSMPFAILPLFVSIMWGLLIFLGFILSIAIFQKTLNIFSLLTDKLQFFHFPSYCLIAVFLLTKNLSDHIIFILYNNIALTIAIGLIFYIYVKVKYQDDGRYYVSRLEFIGVHMQYSMLTAWVLIQLCESALISLNYWLDPGSDQFFIGWKNEYWTITIMSVIFSLAVIMLYKYRDVFFALVIAYTLFGIYANQLTLEDSKEIVTITALAEGCLLSGFILLIMGLYPRMVFYVQRSH